MKLDDLDRKLDRLRAAAQQISANLVELEVDSDRRLLEATELEGESGTRWSAASATLTELWRQEGLLETVLERAGKLRGSRRAGELRSLLDGPSIELASSDVPLAERQLLGSSQTVQRCSPDELIRQMSFSFDEVKTVVSGIAAVWETLIPKLDAARRLLGEAEALATEIGESARIDLESASAALEALGALVTADPLSVSPEDLSRLLRTVQSIRDDLETAAVLMRGFDPRILRARELLGRIRTTIDEGRTAREQLVAKISGSAVPPAAPPVSDVGEELEGRLNEIVALAQPGTWREAQRALEDWGARGRTLLDEAQRALDANRAPIEARNQFRGLLEAYQVKAKRLGVVEDPGLADIYSRAQEALYTAPTDLVAAAQLVHRYQQALAVSPAGSGVKR